jgi:hypothetical protein
MAAERRQQVEAVRQRGGERWVLYLRGFGTDGGLKRGEVIRGHWRRMNAGGLSVNISK